LVALGIGTTASWRRVPSLPMQVKCVLRCPAHNEMGARQVARGIRKHPTFIRLVAIVTRAIEIVEIVQRRHSLGSGPRAHEDHGASIAAPDSPLTMAGYFSVIR
jgi:hypothetical protein